MTGEDKAACVGPTTTTKTRFRYFTAGHV